MRKFLSFISEYKSKRKVIGTLVTHIIAIFILTSCANTIPSSTSNISSIDVSKATETKSSLSTTTAEHTIAKVSESQPSETSSASSSTTKITGKLQVHFLDVGQADCILIQSPSGKNMLIDAGNNADGNNVVLYLQKQGVKRIDVLVGTHPHEDHIGGMDNVVNSFDIGNIYMPKASSTTKTLEDLLNSIKNKGLKITTATGGSSINLDSSVEADILAPNGTTYKDLNNYSTVIKMTFGNTSFLFTGDAEDISEQEILSKGYNLKADVLKVGHHGSSSSTSASFLKAVSPKYAIISVGKGNDYGHPSADTLQKLVSTKIQVFRTDESGTIVATSDGKNITIDKKASPIKSQAPPSTTVTKAKSETNVTSNNATKTEKKEVTVYVTKTGEKYHRDGCQYLKKSKIPTSLNDAQSSGYTPCSRCNPPK